MSLFQKSVEKKYLSQLDSVLIDKKYSEFLNYFGNSQRQENIRDAKEEQFQEGFLRELFVNILGYTLNPEPNFNLTTELKNIANSKKADGAILKGDDAIAVIELKSTNTTDLNSIETQAFGYKNHHPKCIYVITSNFEKLRFYIQNAVDHIDFDLFKLTKEQFSLMWLCLAKDNLINGLALKIKESSLLQEENITKKLYADYSKFREAIFNNLVKNNPATDKLLLFKKTQKLLDRFLFIFFAEDRLLLPPNSISEIVKQWTSLKDEFDEYFPLYERFKKYFGYMNTGFKGKKYDIYAYNGGLFAPDEILDNISIDDEILHEHTLKLSNYDFETDVDVNILGHIFEHSLGEIENVQAELKGEVIDQQRTKRKKDGIFYTPKYITKYIVENTVGKLCEEKRAELEIIDEEYAKGRRNRKKEIIKKLDDNLQLYRKWLLNITICDPACGSGAFLNQALEFLINEHKYIDGLESQLLGYAFEFPGVENHILEKNLYGVDINEESVEIAKLSLWLRTASIGRKLSSLNNNIKCGNSLIDDPKVAGEKAFNWFEEFPQVFPFYKNKNKNSYDDIRKKIIESGVLNYPDQGDYDYTDELSEPSFSYKSDSKGFKKYGFDVIIGNPPYVFAREKISEQEKEFYIKKFKSSDYQINTYLLFIEQTINLLKSKGCYGLIVPNAWLMVYSGISLRKLILEKCQLKQIINLEGYSFEGVNVETIIMLASKEKTSQNNFDILLSNEKEFVHSHSKNQIEFANNDGFEFKVFSDDVSDSLTQKLKSNSVDLDSIVQIKAGLQAYEKGKGNPKQKTEDVINRPYDYTFKFDENTYKYLDGKDVGRYNLTWSGLYLKYGEHLAAPRTFNLFNGKKIIIREIAGKFPRCIMSVYVEDVYLYNRSNIAIIEREGKEISLKYITAILNSSLMSFYFLKNTAKSVRKMFPKVILNDLRNFPIKEINIDKQKPYIELVNLMLNLNKEFLLLQSQFISFLTAKFEIEKLSTKLQNWHDLDFKDFLKELNKAKVQLSLSEEADWMKYFNEQKQKVQTLKSEIDKTDKQIDQMVYELYGLSEEEIKIVEEIK